MVIFDSSLAAGALIAIGNYKKYRFDITGIVDEYGHKSYNAGQYICYNKARGINEDIGGDRTKKHYYENYSSDDIWLGKWKNAILDCF
jgi:hypothetical protein